MINYDTYSKWCISKHAETNHYYDKYLPYEFHLRMVDHAASKFEYLLNDEVDVTTGKTREECKEAKIPFFSLRIVARIGCWGHDTIEDARVSYNDAVKVLGKPAAEIIRACTNYGRGRNRDERMPDYIYEDIKNVPGALFVKLCDRIANVQYGKMSGSSMFEKYRKENENFIRKLGYYEQYNDHPLLPMFKYLIRLFED